MDVLRESREQFSAAFQRARDYKRQGAPAGNGFANHGGPIGSGSQGTVSKGWMIDGATGECYPMARKVRNQFHHWNQLACLVASCPSAVAFETVSKLQPNNHDAARLCAGFQMLLNAA